ncbi:hypothetical protein F5Y17DRAFT_396640 [Xylariaceae sp. FL0594]|nr:hypothetical protein F5Y17DRAFT_396640 [Xylariaceae sp. FL0594]
MASRTPPLLEPYVRLPHETSLILLSGVLGTSTNWLVQRYLHTLLTSSSSSPSPSSPNNNSNPSSQPQHASSVSVVLVSFLRDHAFWKDGCRRLGLDLEQTSRKGSFAFVDGLTGLFVPGRSNNNKVEDEARGGGKYVLREATAEHFRKTVEDAVQRVQLSAAAAGGGEAQTVLVIDQPDLLLAVANDAMTAQDLRGAILALREKVHSCIVTVSADEPLIAAQGTTLEKEHASLALSLAHDAQLVMSLRMLETGTAKDVSGVLRITPGGDEDTAGTTTAVEDRELLYFIGGDGGFRVFERGQ